MKIIFQCIQLLVSIQADFIPFPIYPHIHQELQSVAQGEMSLEEVWHLREVLIAELGVWIVNVSSQVEMTSSSRNDEVTSTVMIFGISHPLKLLRHISWSISKHSTSQVGIRKKTIFRLSESIRLRWPFPFEDSGMGLVTV